MNRDTTLRNAHSESLLALFIRFLWFGCNAWGGPMVQIALLKQELVEKARWVPKETFNRVLALYQALPGPEAMELCVYFGMIRRGRWGAFVAGLGFLLPGVTLMVLAAWLYANQAIQSGDVRLMLTLMQPVVVALLFRAAWQISKGVVTSVYLVLLAVVSCLMELHGIPFWITLPLAGICVVISDLNRRYGLLFILTVALCATLWSSSATSAASTGEPQTVAAIWSLIEMGLRAGLLSFGGAYAAIPFLEMAAVGSGWVSLQALVDGIAINSMLPAPLISIGSFIGFLSMGLLGAVLVTITIFLPAFAITMLLHQQFERWMHSAVLQRVFLGVTVAVVGLILATALRSMGGLGFHPVDFAWMIGALLILISFRRVWITPCVLAGVALMRFVL